jgi:aspartate racemase
MRIAGLIGGIGPESTIDYYGRIVARFRERAPGQGYPRFIVNSVDLDTIVALVTAGQLSELTEFLSAEIDRLRRAGAEFAALTANTPHVVFDALRDRSPIPLISIVEAAGQAARERGFDRLGLFGTRFTMQASFYPEVLGRYGVALVTPAPAERERIHEIYMKELVPGVFLPESRQALLDIATRLKVESGIQGLILGGTELPLILRDSSPLGIPFLDTTQIHVERIVDELLASGA